MALFLPKPARCQKYVKRSLTVPGEHGPRYCCDRWWPWSQIWKAFLGAAQGTHPWIQKHLTLVVVICHIWQRAAIKAVGGEMWKSKMSLLGGVWAGWLWLCRLQQVHPVTPQGIGQPGRSQVNGITLTSSSTALSGSDNRCREVITPL